MRHGTIGGYTQGGCRCPECRAANTTYMRAWRARRTPADAYAHGVWATYSNYHCRCLPCSAAAMRGLALARARRKMQAGGGVESLSPLERQVWDASQV